MDRAIEGFQRIAKAGKIVLAAEKHAEAAAALLDNVGCESLDDAEGRGGILRFPLEDGAGVLRRFQRGGQARRVVRDWYFFVNRPWRELRVHVHAYRSGVSVPEPLGVLWEQRGPLFRGAIASRFVEAETLSRHFRTEGGRIDAALRTSGAEIRKLHEAGVVHGDLQTGNILVGPGGVYLIDFDKAKVRTSLRPLDRAHNLLRLRRSFEKRGLGRERFALVLEGYGGWETPRWLERLYGLKHRLSGGMRG